MNDNLLSFISDSYKYGFSTNLEKEYFPIGLNEEILVLLSSQKKEPYFLKEFRLKSYLKWVKMRSPEWANLNIPPIPYNDICYYSQPKKDKYKTNSDAVNATLLETFSKLGINLQNNEKSPGVAIDAVFDSKSVATTYKEKLAKAGVIFCSISDAIQNYPDLIMEYLGFVVPPGDNFFAALNSAVFSDGSFCYVPKNVTCPLELSTYFRINDEHAGQFERTLIVAEKNSTVKYLEGCTATAYSRNQLHAAIVELIAYENAKIEYSTVQNWYSGNNEGLGGIYNFVTKRGLCVGENSQIFWTQVEAGSAITWKYPSCILLGKASLGKFYSIALTNFFQQADTGTKMIHLGEYTKSTIISKGIASGCSKNSYRGLVKIGQKANYARNFSQCDSFIIGASSFSNTYPYFDNFNLTAIIEHEAKISKLSEEQLFYLLQRGISLSKAVNLIITGFCKDVILKLPLEFANEADKLLSLKLDNSIG
jgi:Fe-S cluster assembly protein SufB